MRPGTGTIEEGGYQINYEIYDGVYYAMIASAILFALASLFGVVGSISVSRNNWALVQNMMRLIQTIAK
jgi:hypothetical protein